MRVIELTNLTQAAARQWVNKIHRHLDYPVGDVCRVGLSVDGELVSQLPAQVTTEAHAMTQHDTNLEHLYARLDFEQGLSDEAPVSISLGLLRAVYADLTELEAAQAASAAENERLTAIESAAWQAVAAMQKAPSLNPSNFSEDDAIELSHAIDDVCCELEAALKKTERVNVRPDDL